ncbi:unnamed protein product [Caenorhabditis angaria]|uniref:Uncharacterized protein n=1 Tax=Caenorhabditis angaria TaxID=860376 RepID=A0A9P1MUG0_9PELO|nr:unnamed protein product [Caenorhabditis angaria]
MTTWTFEKFVYLLEYETGFKIYESTQRHLSKAEYLIIPRTVISNDEQAIEQLRVLYEKYKEKMLIYGSAEEMLEYLKRIDRIEYLVQKYMTSTTWNRLPSSCPKYKDITGKITCVTNAEAFGYMRTELTAKIDEFAIFFAGSCKASFTEYIWNITCLSKWGEYKKRMITDESWKSVYEKLCEVCDFEKFKFKYVEEHREREELDKLMEDFKEHRDRYYSDDFLRYLQNPNINKIYAVVAYLHDAIRPLQKELKSLVTTKKASPDFQPIIRRFKGANYEFYLAQEVSQAFPEEDVMPEKESISQCFIVDSPTFDEILAKYGANSIIIVEIPLETNSRNNVYPICNSRGIHKRLVWEEIEDDLYKQIVIAKYCETGNIYEYAERHSQRALKPIMYLTWFRKSLCFHPETSETPLISFKEQYTKPEVLEIIKKLVEDHLIEDQEINGIIDQVFELLPSLNYKQMHDLYYQIILRNILKFCPNFAKLKENQGKYKKNQELDLIYKAVEQFYELNGSCADCETRTAALKDELIALRRSQKKQLEEIRKLKKDRKICEKQKNDVLNVVCGLKNHLNESQNELIDGIISKMNEEIVQDYDHDDFDYEMIALKYEQ